MSWSFSRSAAGELLTSGFSESVIGHRTLAIATYVKAQQLFSSFNTWRRGMTQQATTQKAGSNNRIHEHRTAKVTEIVSTSTKSFEQAVQNGISDAAATTRGISSAHVQNMSVACENGKIVECKVNMKIAFGIERTPKA